MSYPESVRYLYALGNELKAGAKFGLDRMRTLMAAMGHPERSGRFIHVAGTNGKGSISAMISAVLQESGLRTGLYTSPHLISPTERIQVDGSSISEENFSKAFAEVHAVAEELIAREAMDAHPSYFETMTAMAFLYLGNHADISVIEVGLGGRFDATNVIDPEVCIITPISFDHEAFLGTTIEAIASEKAGIIKPNVPVVIAAGQHPEAERVIRGAAPAAISANSVQFSDIRVAAESSTFVSGNILFTCPLAGHHQLENARTAIAACRQLKVPDQVIAAGLAKTKWPGRLEIVRRSPNFILDGAHNPAGAACLATHIREFYSDRPVWIVFGAMRDKALEEITAQLFPLADRLIATAPNFPRALRPEAILEMHPHWNGMAAKNLPTAIEIASAAPPEASVFFAGSLFLVGEARALLLQIS